MISLPNREIIIEACVETYVDAISAFKNGANQIELCADLEEGGTTPDYHLAVQLKNEISVPIKIMIRSRSGDFAYGSDDINLMIEQIIQFKSLGFSKFVFGAITADGHLDLNTIAIISAAIGTEGELCIHKAIDLCENIIAELAALSAYSNITEVLTSGGQNTAKEGAAMLKKMITHCPLGIDIIAAGKITKANLLEHQKLIGAKKYHGRKIV